jgi:hypothetical protein
MRGATRGTILPRRRHANGNQVRQLMNFFREHLVTLCYYTFNFVSSDSRARARTQFSNLRGGHFTSLRCSRFPPRSFHVDKKQRPASGELIE